MDELELQERLREGLPAPPAGMALAPIDAIRRRALRRSRARRGFSALSVCALAVTIGFSVYAVQGRRPGDHVTAMGECDVSTGPLATRSPLMFGPTPHPVNAGSLSEILNTVHVMGESRYGDAYAGVLMDTDLDRVFVWRKESAEFDRELSTISGREKLVIGCADYSLKELLDVAAKLHRDEEYWRNQAMPLPRFGPRVDGSCVEVAVNDTQRAERELRQRYPGMPLCVVKSDDGLAVPFSGS